MTQRDPAGLVTCLESHSMEVYSIPCDVPLPTLYLRSLFSLLGVQEIPTCRPESKRNTADVDLFDRVRSFFRSRNMREGRRDDRRGSRDRICLETRRVLQKAKPPPDKKSNNNKKKTTRNKERKKKHALFVRRKMSNM